MKPTNYLILGTVLSLLFAARAVSGAPSAQTGQILDPATVAWPRTFTADGYDMAIFQPQISTWKGNQLAGRFAVGVRPTGSKDEAYGVVSFTARAEIDKLNRLVTLEDLELGKVNFPTQYAKEAQYLALLKKHLPEKAKTIPLDHLETIFVLSGEVEKQAEVAVKNDPPPLNCLRAFYAAHPLNLCASSPLDSRTHGSRNTYPNCADPPATNATCLLSNPQCARHPVFRWSIPSACRLSTGVGPVHISWPGAGRRCLSRLGASEMALAGGNC
jgi:hypothetical protein